MSDRGALSPDEIDGWVERASTGEQRTYAWGDDLPTALPGVKAAKRLHAEGLINFTSRRISPGRREYLMIRLGGQARARAVKAAAGYAPPDSPDAIIMQELRRAASASRPCPSNNELARKANLPDAYAASYVVRKLRNNGKIRVELFGPHRNWRVITIVSSGARTALERR